MLMAIVSTSYETHYKIDLHQVNNHSKIIVTAQFNRSTTICNYNGESYNYHSNNLNAIVY